MKKYVIMKYIKFFILIQLIFLTTGCYQPVVRNNDNKTLVNFNKPNDFNLYDNYVISDVIPLETSEKSLFGDIKRLFVTDSMLIIFTKEENKILLFSNKGKFIKQIGNKGRGNNEYIYLNDIDFDYEKKYIYAFDRYTNKMYIYDLNGMIIEKIDSKFDFNSFVKTDKGYWLYSCFSTNNPENYNLIFVNDNLSNIEKGFFRTANFLEVTFEPTFSKTQEGEIFFHFPMDESVYIITKDYDVRKIFNPDYGNRRFPFELVKDVTSHLELDQIKNKNNYIGTPSKVITNGNNMYIKCIETPIGVPVSSYLIDYDIEKMEAILYDKYIIPENNLYINLFNIEGVYDNQFIYSINPGQCTKFDFEILQRKYNLEIDFESNLILVYFKKIKN